jgi:hypothetical protein
MPDPIALFLRKTVFDHGVSPDDYRVIWLTEHHGERRVRPPQPRQRKPSYVATGVIRRSQINFSGDDAAIKEERNSISVRRVI